MQSEKTIAALAYYDHHFDDLFEEFLAFLRIPSVSTSPERAADIQLASQFLVNKFTSIGFNHAKAYPTGLHPIVYADLVTNPQKPTVLIYGHYDVQPPDPITQWVTPPFEPQIRGDYLFARGASDMKGQIWSFISALQSILATGDLPVNIKMMIEGEEEIGSPSLDQFLEEHRELLKSDLVLNLDAGMLAPDKPTMIISLRGLAYFEIRLFGPDADLHSGVFGGAILNPANVLCHVIAGMHDAEGRVTLPGFYDQVRTVSTADRADLAQLEMNDDFYKTLSGVNALGGEQGFTAVERVGIRPSLDVNGLIAGFTGSGAKTIIPASATAKLSTRLVADQDPHRIHDGLLAYLEENVPDGIRWECDYMSGAPAYVSDDAAPGIDLFKAALRQTWGVEPLKKREGGSIPVATAMKNILGIDSIVSGFGLPDDRIHSPNEHLHLPTHKKGVAALITYFLSF